MRIDQFESADRKDDGDRPWRKFGTPLNKKPSDPNNPNNRGPINHDEWMKSSKPMEEDTSEMPEAGDTIRTNKSEMDGKVDRIEGNIVFFRIADGRLMKTGLNNVTVVQKLADGDSEIMEDELDEVSNELLAKYKTAAGKSASDADKQGDYKTGDKRFKGIVRATNKQFDNDSKKAPTKEGMMGGINRSAPATDISYEKMLDEVYSKWNEEQQVNELSVDTMRSYTQAANKTSNIQQRPLRKVVKTVRGVKQANDKIDSRTGKGRAVAPNSGTNEDCWDGYQQIGMKDKGGKQVPNCVPDANEALDPWQGYTKDDKKANAQAKAPKSAKHGTAEFRMSDMIQDTINVHGVKHAFEYYVKKHGMPPRHFQILAGLTANKPAAPKQLEPLPQERGMEKEPEKQSWWKKLRGKLPFEE